MFSLARALFSPDSAEDRTSLFVWFIDSMARSDSSRACASAVWLCAFADRPRSLAGRGAPEVSRFSCMLFLSVRGFYDYAGPTARSRLSRSEEHTSELQSRLHLVCRLLLEQKRLPRRVGTGPRHPDRLPRRLRSRRGGRSAGVRHPSRPVAAPGGPAGARPLARDDRAPPRH